MCACHEERTQVMQRCYRIGDVLTGACGGARLPNSLSENRFVPLPAAWDFSCKKRRVASLPYFIQGKQNEQR